MVSGHRKERGGGPDEGLRGGGLPWKSLLWRRQGVGRQGGSCGPGLPRRPVLEATAHLHP